MHIDGLDDDAIRRVLAETRRIAVVGASANATRPSYGVARFLVSCGYTVIPVNPGLSGQTLHGHPVMADLASAGALDMVDIFRNANDVAPVVDTAIRLQARTIWMQLGVINEAAAARARDAGLTVVMDRCPVIECGRLGISGPA